MAVIDVFSYNGEADMLNLRLNILDSLVDQFILVESPLTFSGKPKPLYYELEKEKFAKWNHKIKYFVIDDFSSEELWNIARNSPNTKGAEHWKMEFYQKEYIQAALLHLNDEDTVYISDCDEIWKPKEIGDEIYKLKQLMYVYFYNQRTTENWAGTFVAKYKNIKNECLNHIRANATAWLSKPESYKNCLDDGGWHFTSMGGLDELKRKLDSSYTEEDYWHNSTQAMVEANYLAGYDAWGRNFKFWVDESEWPAWLKENRQAYQHLLK